MVNRPHGHLKVRVWAVETLAGDAGDAGDASNPEGKNVENTRERKQEVKIEIRSRDLESSPASPASPATRPPLPACDHVNPQTFVRRQIVWCQFCSEGCYFLKGSEMRSLLFTIAFFVFVAMLFPRQSEAQCSRVESGISINTPDQCTAHQGVLADRPVLGAIAERPVLGAPVRIVGRVAGRIVEAEPLRRVKRLVFAPFRWIRGC